MKLDTHAIRYLTFEDWRVLTAVCFHYPPGSESGGAFDNEWQAQVESGSRNHEVVPTSLIAQISGLRGASGVNKSISAIAKVGLIAKVKNAKCLFRPCLLL